MDPNQDRFERLWREAERNVKGTVAKSARSATREDRENLVQTVRFKAWRAFGAYDREKPFAAWVCRIAIHVRLDWRRAATKRPETLPIHTEDWREPAEEPTQHEFAVMDEVSPELREAIARLKPLVRQTFLLCLSGHSYEETAALIGCPLGTVRTRQHRATARLRELLGPDFLANRG